MTNDDINEVCDDCGERANYLTRMKKYGAPPKKRKFDVSTETEKDMKEPHYELRQFLAIIVASLSAGLFANSFLVAWAVMSSLAAIIITIQES